MREPRELDVIIEKDGHKTYGIVQGKTKFFTMIYKHVKGLHDKGYRPTYMTTVLNTDIKKIEKLTVEKAML